MEFLIRVLNILALTLCFYFAARAYRGRKDLEAAFWSTLVVTSTVRVVQAMI